MAALAGHLANPHFARKAVAEVVAECWANLAAAEAQRELVRRRLVELGSHRLEAGTNDLNAADPSRLWL